jgi:hypothetical protein
MGKTKTSKPKRPKGKNGKVETVQMGNSTVVIEILDLQEAADFLRVSKKALEEDAKKGVVPGKFVAGEWRFLKQALYNWLNCAFTLSVSDLKEPESPQRVLKSMPAAQRKLVDLPYSDETTEEQEAYRKRMREIRDEAGTVGDDPR